MKKQELFSKMLINCKCNKMSSEHESCGQKRFVRSMLNILSIRFLKSSSNPIAKICTQIFNSFSQHLDIQNRQVYIFLLSQKVSTTCSMKLIFFINKMTYTQELKNSAFLFIIFFKNNFLYLKNYFLLISKHCFLFTNCCNFDSIQSKVLMFSPSKIL